MKAGKPLGERVERRFFRGVTSGLNDAFIIDAETKRSLIAKDKRSAELIHPLLGGEDIRRYIFHETGLRLIFTRRGVDIDRYPAIQEHLAQWKDDLAPKRDKNVKRGRKPGHYEWYEIQDDVAYYEVFDRPKIIFPDICKGPRFSLDTGDHLFTYHGNVFDHQMEIERWLKYVPVLDARQEPVVEVAVYYPETENQVGDAAFRHLYAWGFNPVAREIRRVVEVDYLDERLIRDGFLDRYKVLVFAWGNQIPADVQALVDAWLRKGGTIIYPSYPRGPQEAVGADPVPAVHSPGEGFAAFARWSASDTGKGSFHRFPGDAEPPELYGEFVAKVLRDVGGLHPWTRSVLEAKRPPRVFFSVQKDGHALVLNYNDQPARVSVAGADRTIEPYGIERVNLGSAAAR